MPRVVSILHYTAKDPSLLRKAVFTANSDISKHYTNAVKYSNSRTYPRIYAIYTQQMIYLGGGSHLVLQLHRSGYKELLFRLAEILVKSFLLDKVSAPLAT